MICLLCRSEDLRFLGNAGIRPGSVTSDSRPCTLPARVWQCPRCGHLQKAPDAAERATIDAVYAGYAAHHLSGGREQLTFVPGVPPRPRSQHALEQLRGVLPSAGRLLDVGTGAGAVLASAHRTLPGWELHAFDVSEHRRVEIERLPHVHGFYSGEIETVPDLEFDLVVLWHVLEHLDDPVRVLSQLRRLLSAQGRILIQVPDVERNAYDLAVIDHASHFSAAHLDALAGACGLQVAVDGRTWFHNCLTVVLTSSDDGVERPVQVGHGPIDSPVEWLRAMVRHFDEQRGAGDYAIFGTGMAGIWLAGQFDRPPAYFIDEDESRWGQMIGGVVIVGPDSLAAGVPVLMAFDAGAGEAIAARLRRQYPSLGGAPLILSLPKVAS